MTETPHVAVTGVWCAPDAVLDAADPALVVVVDEAMAPLGVVPSRDVRSLAERGENSFHSLRLHRPQPKPGGGPGTKRYWFGDALYVEESAGRLTLGSIAGAPRATPRWSDQFRRSAGDSRLAGKYRLPPLVRECRPYGHPNRIVAWYTGMYCQMDDPEPHLFAPEG